MMITWSIVCEATRECDNVQTNNQGTKEIKFRNFLSTILYIYLYIYIHIYINILRNCIYVHIYTYVRIVTH